MGDAACALTLDNARYTAVVVPILTPARAAPAARQGD